MPKNREREVKVSESQKLAMLEFMEKNTDFAKGKLFTIEKKHTWINIWETLARKLNTMRGARKTTSKWQRAWSDLKNKVKRKTKEINKLENKGYKTQTSVKLNDFEKRLMAFVTDDTCGIRMYKENGEIVMEIDDALSTNTTFSDDSSENSGDEISLEIVDVQENYITFPPTLEKNGLQINPVSRKVPTKPKEIANNAIKKTKPQEYKDKKLDILTDIGKELKKTNELLRNLVILIKDSNKNN